MRNKFSRGFVAFVTSNANIWINIIVRCRDLYLGIRIKYSTATTSQVNVEQGCEVSSNLAMIHRQEEEAFQAYLARYRSQPRAAITKVGDPDFDRKIQAAIEQKMQAHKAQQDLSN